MRGRMIAALMFGVIGTLILLALGIWQVSRMSEKAAVIAGIEAGIVADPVPLPAAPDPEADRYLPVTVTGRFTAQELFVLASQKIAGTGVHIVTAFETADGRRVLVDRGFVPYDDRDAVRPRSAGAVTVVGNLHWPRDADSFTPEPDAASNLWFARDVPAMAAHLGTEPTFIIARSTDEAAPPAAFTPLSTAGIPDNHLSYAITWFLLAAVWMGMTVFLLWRIRQQRA
ncbi:SURF1 family protein [Roseicitreum antarcticum]|uniref:SURF1-like protein n=1 Tax=Roseicitreum antarcticum TaxID=564137 RepID=A0A1H2XKT9_9RHOB|nr:SURF1 family protein [Roseicitreum antarcticum]SDW93513.1 surfeit locus 1 family protein [Roseicitreum antarcticum]